MLAWDSSNMALFRLAMAVLSEARNAVAWPAPPPPRLSPSSKPRLPPPAASDRPSKSILYFCEQACVCQEPRGGLVLKMFPALHGNVIGHRVEHCVAELFAHVYYYEEIASFRCDTQLHNK